MLHILMVNFPAEGHVNPTLGITQAFAARGDQVHYITTEKYKDRLQAVGATVHLHPDLIRTASIDTSTPAGLNAFMNIHIQTSMDILAITKQLSESIDFDFVFYDRFGAGELVRDYLNIPGIASSPSFLISKNQMASNLFRSDAKVPFQLNEQAATSLELMKERFGVAPESMVQFMNNTGALNVVYTSRYFQPDAERFGEESLFIGPSFPERKGEHSFPLDRLQGKKVLYISMGTVLDHIEDFFNTCIEAFSDFEGIVVIAAGEKADFTKINPAPEHFIISPYVPQLEVLRHADVFITHGGMNSVNEGIHFNVPLVVLPQDKDQPLVAQRLTELQAGYRITKDRIHVQSLREAVHEVMSNAAYKEGVQKINDSFQQSGGTEEALAKIDAYLQKELA
ncbi:macrolide family glycosyltransferase [Paenibacillus sp. Aloe-11]|uniref:macrolide family glycosyltransferase n=1 Tax=Paenibacillus sp. Aloe-11 TaxID=1050222 RepID=UPI00024F057F|nr:macrolide family glycosyltransferase [Paenibacillus sp. Aloe-11]EHS55898.1 UDP-glucosyltransferase ydhe [Paenibacillus sp. Aloe-11]